jgi:hypothetical protein
MPTTVLPSATPSGAEAVAGAPNLLLRVEGAAVLAASLIAYGWLGGSWWVLAALFLAPDLFMLGYLRGPRVGAAVYNLGHTYAVTLTLVGLGLWAGWTGLTAAGLIWTAHIGFDRMLGYGLKYARGFNASHLSDGGAERASAVRR